jgi:hypothetical protein
MSQEHLQWYYAESILFSGYWEFHGVQLLGCGANHPLPSSARVQMGWSYISSYHLCLHGVTFTFTIPKVMHFCSRWCWTWLGIQWRHSTPPHIWKFKSQSCAGNLMLTVVFDIKGPLLFDCYLCDDTSSANLCCQILHKLCTEVKTNMQVNSFTAPSWCTTLPICMWGDPFVMVFLDSPYFMDFKKLYSTKFGSECQVNQVFPSHIWYFCQCLWTLWLSHGRRKCRTVTTIISSGHWQERIGEGEGDVFMESGLRLRRMRKLYVRKESVI